MKSKSVLKAAGALAVAAGVVLGAGSWVQATESVGLQIATAEQTAAVKQRQELMKSIDRKSTRRTPVTNAHLVCRLLLEKKKIKKNDTHAHDEKHGKATCQPTRHN